MAAPPVAYAIVFRHGARGVTSAVGSKLQELFPPGPRGHACAEWALSEMEDITDVGVDQMHVLGTWFARYITRGGAPTTTARWRSSLAPRAVESGEHFMAGFAAAGTPHTPASAPEPYATPADADHTFREWNTSPAYKAALASLPQTEAFQTAGVHTIPRSNRLYAALTGGGAAPLPEDLSPSTGSTGSSGSSGSDAAARVRADAATRLWHCTYLKELYDCEVAWRDTATAIRAAIGATSAGGSASGGPAAPRGDEAGGATGGAASSASATGAASTAGDPAAAAPPAPRKGTTIDAKHFAPTGEGVLVVPNPKRRFLAALAPEDERAVVHSARWVWDQRFFSSPLAKKWAPTLAGPLLRELLQGLRDGVVAGCYSAHDYTILSLLAALRVKAHPAACLGFGSFLLLECRRGSGSGGGGGGAASSSAGAGDADGGDAPRVTARLCVDPFPWSRYGSPCDLVPTMETIFEDAALDGLLALADRMPTLAALRAAAAAYAAEAAAAAPVVDARAESGPGSSAGASAGAAAAARAPTAVAAAAAPPAAGATTYGTV